MKIIFTDIQDSNIVENELKPYKASQFIPEWYKNTPSYLNTNEKKITIDVRVPGTIKRCMPVFDAMTAGYIIPSYTDVWVTQKDGAPYYMWPTGTPIEFHPPEQAPIHPKSTGNAVPKWMSPWAIQTPKGYSTLFVPPLHRDNPYFTILPGLVDTDDYRVPVNFPFVLNDPSFEGLIPAGTPIAQLIPIKREPWNMTNGTTKDVEFVTKQYKSLRSVWFDAYKRKFRQPKEYN